MQPRPLLVVLAAVFAGLSVVLVVAAAVTTTPLVLLAAVPLAITAVLMWYQGTGRLAPRSFGRDRRRRRHARTRTTVGEATRTTHSKRGAVDDDRGTVSEDPRRTSVRDEAAREARTRARRQARRRAHDDASASGGTGASGGRRQRSERADRFGGLTRADAYDVLGLDPSAGDDAVREAYREKAKTAHPDTEGGSAESFQELNDAYERLIDD